MGLDRADLKSRAKEELKGKWGTVIGIVVVQILIETALTFIPIVRWFSFLVTPAITLGFTMTGLRLVRHEDIDVGNLFDGMQYFFKAFGLVFMTGLFTFLWALLLIVPGIVAAYRYGMAIYILADNPELGIMECIDKSKEMTNGNKGFMFILDLSFIGWGILAALTFGIGCLWLIPYIGITNTLMYMQLSGGTVGNGENQTGDRVYSEQSVQ